MSGGVRVYGIVLAIAVASLLLSTGIASAFTCPADPASLANTTGNFWVNHTWTRSDLGTWYLISGDMAGTFSGFNWTGSTWQSDSVIASGLGDVGMYSKPEVFLKDGTRYLISGEVSSFKGFNWTGSTWQSDSAIVSGLGTVILCNPTVFEKDGAWYLISGNNGGGFNGYNWTGSAWQVNNTIVNGLGDVGSNSAPTAFEKGGTWYLISGENGGVFHGFNWTGSAWQVDNAISGGDAVGGLSNPDVFMVADTWYQEAWYRISGDAAGGSSGWCWNGSVWVADSGVVAGLGDTGSWSAPAIFNFRTPGNITDSYNVSVNGGWHNNTTVAHYNDTYSAHAWQNITIYAYNTSAGGNLSAGNVSQDTQIPNNPITITNTSDWSGNEGENIYVDYDATDADGDTPTFSCSRTDLFTDFDTATGKGNCTAPAGVHYVDFGVSDGWGSIDNYTMSIIVSFTPSNPSNLMNTTGNFWVNHTWEAGTGNVTDSYNVSVNSVWHNSTPAHYNDTYTAHAWQNITVYAYNTTGVGTLSPGNVSQDTQIPTNPITITNTSDWSGNEGENVYVDYDATDADGDTPTFSCSRTDLFTDFDTATGKGNCTAPAGVLYVDFGVSDGWGSIDNYTMSIIVSYTPNNPSTLSNTTGRFWVNHTWSGSGDGVWKMLAGRDVGDCIGFNWSGSGWVADPGIDDGITDLGWRSMPTAFKEYGTQYLIRGVGSIFYGYRWTGSTWQSDSAIVSGLGAIHLCAPTVFVKDGTRYLISGENGGVFHGFNWTGSAWQSDSGIAGGLGDVGLYSTPTVFQKDGTWYLISGENAGAFYGFNWTGTTWQVDDAISGLPSVGSWSAPDVFQRDSTWYLIAGNMNGDFDGWYWNSSDMWEAQSWIVSGLPDVGSWSAPAVFDMGNTTDSYNVSVNGVWYNSTPAHYNDTYTAHAWQNITVYAYNNTGGGTLSAGNISQDTQIPNSPVTITNASDWNGAPGMNVYVDYDSTDPDSDTPTFSCNRTDLFTDFDTATGQGNWTAAIGTYYVDFGVSDGWGSTSNYTMTITVAMGQRIPPDPTTLANTTGNFWVNHTWAAGSGNVTDSYNVSVNQTWHNTTTNTFWNNTGLSAHGWSNITVYSWNNSAGGTLSAGNISQDTQIPNNDPSAGSPSPNNGATGISTNPTLQVTVTDIDTDTMNVSFYEQGGSQIGSTQTGIASGGTASVGWGGRGYSTTYHWYVTTNDTYNETTSAVWHFTTESGGPTHQVTIEDCNNRQTTEGGEIYNDFNYTNDDPDTPVFTTNATKGTLNSSTGVYNWTTGVGDAGVYVWWFMATNAFGNHDECTVTFTVTSSDVQPPTNLQHTTGNFWVRHSWTPGANTDSFNVSVNSAWHNSTANAFWDNAGMSAHGWSNISVAGYNTTTGHLSAFIGEDTQIPNNPITITNTSDWNGDTGENVYVDYDATDADADTPTFSCSRTDLFTDFNTATGTGNWTPALNGTYYVDFGVSDGWGSTSNYSMEIRVGVSGGIRTETKVPVSIFIALMVLMLCGVLYVFYAKTHISRIFTTLIAAWMAFMLSQMIVSGNVVRMVSALNSTDTWTHDTIPIQIPGLSYLLLFIGVILSIFLVKFVVVFGLEVIREARREDM